MNCKPGDLAVVVRSECGNQGRIVRCIRLASETEADRVHYWFGALWHIDVELKSSRYGGTEWRFIRFCPDANLRPLRDPGDDATDEMVLIAGKPQEVTA